MSKKLLFSIMIVVLLLSLAAISVFATLQGQYGSGTWPISECNHTDDFYTISLVGSEVSMGRDAYHCSYYIQYANGVCRSCGKIVSYAPYQYHYENHLFNGPDMSYCVKCGYPN